MEIIHESIYDHPKYYDLVFGADCAAEGKFILGCAQKHMGRAARRMFEPACGTGRLLHWFARKGYEVGGLDLNPAAIEFCNARLKRHGFDDTAMVADMSDFRVKKKYDIAFNTINSFRHLDSQRAAADHLKCMSSAIRVGGLYLLGLHLTPTQAEPSEGESWSARRGHLSVTTQMWTNDRNTKTRVERFGIRFDIHSPSRSFRIEDELVLRSYTDKQMGRLIRDSKLWEVVATYDFGYDLRNPIEVDAASEDVVYVMRRITPRRGA